LSAARRARYHRAAGGGGEVRQSPPQGLRRMAILEPGPHLFPDRSEESVHRGVHMAVGLRNVSSRRAAHHRGYAAGQRVSSSLADRRAGWVCVAEECAGYSSAFATVAENRHSASPAFISTTARRVKLKCLYPRL